MGTIIQFPTHRTRRHWGHMRGYLAFWERIAVQSGFDEQAGRLLCTSFHVMGNRAFEMSNLPRIPKRIVAITGPT